MSDTTETDAILEMRNLGWDQLQDFARRLERERDEARRKYKRAEDYIEKMDAVIDDCGIAKSCINPLEDLKRATTAVKERADKAEAALVEAKRIKTHAH